MLKKDLGLLVLILIVGTTVALINPLFISPINVANTANLVGLFGIFALGQAFVIITGGIELSVGSIIALLGVLFVDLLVNHGVPWPAALLLMLALGAVMGLAHGLLITKLHLQAFIVTLCGLLIYRGAARYYTADATAGFAFGASFPELEWLTTGRTFGVPHSLFAMVALAAVMWVVLHRSVFGRYLYAVGKNEEAARYSGVPTDRVIVAAYVICGLLTAISAIFFAMYTRFDLAVLARQFLRALCDRRRGAGGLLAARRRRVDRRRRARTILLQVLQNLVNLLGIPSSLNFAVMGSVILVGVLGDTQFAKYRQRKLAGKAALSAPTPKRQPGPVGPSGGRS